MRLLSSKEQIPSDFKHVHLDGPSRLRQLHQRKKDRWTDRWTHKWTHPAVGTSANSTFIWPGMRPATGCTPNLSSHSSRFPTSLKPNRTGCAISYPKSPFRSIWLDRKPPRWIRILHLKCVFSPQTRSKPVSNFPHSIQAKDELYMYMYNWKCKSVQCNRVQYSIPSAPTKESTICPALARNFKTIVVLAQHRSQFSHWCLCPGHSHTSVGDRPLGWSVGQKRKMRSDGKIGA